MRRIVGQVILGEMSARLGMNSRRLPHVGDLFPDL